MSALTHAVLITPEHPSEMPMRELHAWCRHNADGQVFEPIFRPGLEEFPWQPGGRKVFCRGIYALCGKAFPAEGLVRAFPTFGWGDPKKGGKYLATTTILIIQHDDDDDWHTIHGDGQPARVWGGGPPARHCKSGVCVWPLFQDCVCSCEGCFYARASGVL